jgi:hypothetical protein
MKSLDNINPSTVNFLPIKENLNGELYKEPYVECSFCEKLFKITSGHQNIINKLSDKVYCAFCIRHSHQTKAQKDILILTFRSVIGHYYYCHYKKDKFMWLSEIKDCIDNHIEAGMSNPFFNYDDETFLWFVDFNRVGKSAKKINKGVVIEVVSKIVSTFNIEKNMGCNNRNKFFSKYIDAINLFYSHRKRPHDRNILNPTLSNMAVRESATKLDYNIDKIKNFTSKDLKCC